MLRGFISLPLWILQLPTHHSEVQSVPSNLKEQAGSYLPAGTTLYLVLSLASYQKNQGMLTHHHALSYSFGQQPSENPLVSVPKFINYIAQEALASKQPARRMQAPKPHLRFKPLTRSKRETWTLLWILPAPCHGWYLGFHHWSSLSAQSLNNACGYWHSGVS